MPPFPDSENLFQFIWQFQYFNTDSLHTCEGEPIAIEHPGDRNTGQGPDFTQARIRIGATLWAGDVELHLKASDWDRHGHPNSELYEKVILHVVWVNDLANVPPHLPMLVLNNRIRHHMVQTYGEWMKNTLSVPCGKQVSGVSSLIIKSWLDRMTLERLDAKAQSILSLRHRPNGQWEEISWQLVAKTFGGNRNGHAFSEMAIRLPLRILNRHRHQIHQTEALMLGTAGMLQRLFSDAYPKMLQKEFLYLQKRYGLKVSPFPVIYHPLRPFNFPSIRMAQLSMLLHSDSSLWSFLREENSLERIRDKFRITANDYWNDHFIPDEKSVFLPKQTGDSFIDCILINAVVPLLYALGVETGRSSYNEKALEWLSQLKTENNGMVRDFIRLGWKPANAFDTQALVHLRTNYCTARNCLQCGIGAALLQKRSND